MKLKLTDHYRGWATGHVRYEAGDVIDVADDVAEQIMSWGIAEKVHANTKATEKDQEDNE